MGIKISTLEFWGDTNSIQTKQKQLWLKWAGWVDYRDGILRPLNVFHASSFQLIQSGTNSFLSFLFYTKGGTMVSHESIALEFPSPLD